MHANSHTATAAAHAAVRFSFDTEEVACKSPCAEHLPKILELSIFWEGLSLAMPGQWLRWLRGKHHGLRLDLTKHHPNSVTECYCCIREPLQSSGTIGQRHKIIYIVQDADTVVLLYNWPLCWTMHLDMPMRAISKQHKERGAERAILLQACTRCVRFSYSARYNGPHRAVPRATKGDLHQ